MDFSNVGMAAIQAAVTSTADGLPEEEYTRYGQLWELLHDKHFTDMAGVKTLAGMTDEETLNALRAGKTFQEADLPRLSELLIEAHRLAHDPDALEKWASR